MTASSRNKSLLPRKAAAIIGAVTFLCLTTAGTYPDVNDPAPGTPGYWERMVLTIGLGATLAIMNYGLTAWLLKNVMRTAENRENTLMAQMDRIQDRNSERERILTHEMTASREAFQDALDKLCIPLRLSSHGSEAVRQAFDQALHREPKHEGETP